MSAAFRRYLAADGRYVSQLQFNTAFYGCVMVIGVVVYVVSSGL